MKDANISFAVGLDPPTMTNLSLLLRSLAKSGSPQLVLGLRPQDPVPEWITHVMRLGDNFQVTYQGSKKDMGSEAKPSRRIFPKIGMSSLYIMIRIARASKLRVRRSLDLTCTGTGSLGRFDLPIKAVPQRGLTKSYRIWDIRALPGPSFSSSQVESTESREGIPLIDADVPVSNSEILVDMRGVRVKYGDKEVLGSWEQEIDGQKKKGLSWTIRRGERWGVFGPNGMYLLARPGRRT